MNRSAGIALAAGVGATALVALGFYLRYVADGPPEQYSDPVEFFKYGSYGSEKTSLPSPIWKALPEICHDLLPGGWAEIGLNTEPGHDLPVGISRRKYGVERVGLNCAACHSGVRESDSGPRLMLGIPSPSFDSQRYRDFITSCVLSEHFTNDNVLAAVDKVGAFMPFYDRLFYRVYLLDQIRKGARDAKQHLAWMDSRPVWGPGRTDTANLFRMVLDQHPERDHVAGPVDYPSLWNQGLRAKEGGGQHWDGDNDSFRERSYTSALASGATEDSLDAPPSTACAIGSPTCRDLASRIPSTPRRPRKAKRSGLARSATTATTSAAASRAR